MSVPHIIVVCDAPDFRQAIAECLRRESESGEWRVDYARNCAEGIVLLDSSMGDDIFLLDIQTPIEEALSLFRRVEDRRSRAKFVIVAASQGDGPRATLNRDVFDALSKHVAFQPLKTLLRRVLGEPVATNAVTEEAQRRVELQSLLRSSVLFSQIDEDAMRAMTAAFETVMLDGGEVLFRQGDPGDSLYVVVSGRLEIVSAPPGQPRKVVATLGPGESVGEMALIDGEPRSATVAATRDTVLARLSDADFQRLINRHPKPILSAFLRQLSKRLRGEIARVSESKPTNGCIAIVPLAPEVDVAPFARSISQGLGQFLSALPLSFESLDEAYGLKGAAQFVAGEVGHLLLASWLAEQERKYQSIVYTAQFGSTPWTCRCLRQADLVLFVVGRESDPVLARSLMREFSAIGDLSKKRRLLAILHSPQHPEPRRTRVWTEAVGPDRLFHVRADNPDDMGRLTRFLCGRSVGLALGGGLARGLGHIGVIRAMRELGVPIDMVGGTSMGAIIAGQCALEWDWRKMLDISMHRSAAAIRGDFTLPLVSFMTGRKISQTIEEFGDGRDFEDALLPSFCVSANLMDGQMWVHTTGPAAKGVLASARLPVMFPPISWGKALLVDGGLVNMVPAKTMREFCNGGVVVSVDCSATREFRAPHYGMSHSGWKELWRRLRARPGKPPTLGIMDILMQAFEFGRAGHANPALYADLHLVLPLTHYSHRDFFVGPQMVEASYRYALDSLEAWIAENGRPWEPNGGA